MTDRKPTEQTVFLVSGGAKGITAQCVIELARRYKSRFILVGRSAYEAAPEPSWATGVADEPALKRAAMAHLSAAGERPTPRAVQRMVSQVQSQREIGETLAAVAAAGGKAVYVPADVTDAEALERAAAEGARQVGPITGIVHGAGVLADKLVQDKAAADFDFVLGVKMAGLRALLRCVAPEQLAYLVLFSSVAGFYGNAGQADYAAANEVLNKTAHWIHARYPHCHTLAVNWGPWRGGMVTPELERQMALRNVQVIAPEVGTGLLADLLSQPVSNTQTGADSAQAAASTQVMSPVQVVVGSPILPPHRKSPEEEQTIQITRRLRLEDNPFLRDHVIGGSPVLPTVCAISWMANAAEQLYPGYSFFRVDDYRVFKGIVFDSEQPETYILDLTSHPRTHSPSAGTHSLSAGTDSPSAGTDSPSAGTDSPSAGTDSPSAGEALTFTCLIWSKLASGRRRYHYRADVMLRQSAPAAPVREHLYHLHGPMFPGAKLYRDRALFHGPSFQGIERVLGIDETGLTLRCILPDLPPATQGQFPVQAFNPFVVDSQLQSLLVWATHYLGYGGLPLRIKVGIQYRPLRFEMPTLVSMTVVSQTPRRLIANVVVREAVPDGAGGESPGKVCMEVLGAEITLSERLPELFKQNRVSS